MSTKKKKKASRLTISMNDLSEAPAPKTTTKKASKRPGRKKASEARMSSVSMPVPLIARLQRHAVDALASEGRKPALWQILEEALGLWEKDRKASK